MGAEGAMEWVLSHMEDANFNDPLSEPSQAAAQASTTGAAAAPPAAADPESVMMLVSMGFTDQQAAAALKVSIHADCHSHVNVFGIMDIARIGAQQCPTTFIH